MKTVFLFLHFWLFISCHGFFSQSLRTEVIFIGPQKLTVEIAASPEQRERGLMYRSGLEPEHGMLFIFRRPDVQTFWMKNTLIPLDIGFFDRDGFLIRHYSMAVENDMEEKSLTRYSSMEPALYAVETVEGWFNKHGLRRYAEMKLPYKMQGL